MMLYVRKLVGKTAAEGSRINNNRSRQQVDWLTEAFAGAGLDIDDDFP
ncbi:hypothetical protein HGH92_18065 [Chitinophaga varians]|uniref:Uncharacterized protein n=1 Tax=Chitinophaga varians TaxID=2202339 RepID=A0A847S022_9BACT|nr:hypothetical protein [Chitinophaga varians]NLR66217.1 hypothetical protein [Chitinophaga varians]